MKRLLLISTLLCSGCVSSAHDWDLPWAESPQFYKPKSEMLKQVTQNRPNENLNSPNRYPIDLDTTLRLAAKNNLEIALTREAVHSAYAKAIMAQEAFVPNAGPIYNFWRSEGTTQSTAGEFLTGVNKQNNFVGGGIRLAWPLGDAIFNTLSAQRRFEASEASLAVVSQDIILNAAVAYFDLLQADQKVGIYEEAVKISDEVYRETKAAATIGKGFQGDVLRTQAEKTHNQLALEQAQNSLSQASIRLVSILRLDPRIELYPADNTAVPLKIVSEDNLEELFRKAVQRRPEIAEAKKQIEAAKQEQNAATWGGIIPDVLAGGTSGKFGGVPDDLNTQRIYQVTLGWKIGPGGLFDIGRQQLTLSAVRSNEVRLQRMTQLVSDEVKSSFVSVQSQSEQMKRADEEVKEAKESLRLNQLRQSAGFGIPLEVIQAEQALISARLDYVQAVVGYNKAEYRLFIGIGERQ